MSRIESFLRFLWDFGIGDDWRIAAGVALALVLTWFLVQAGVDTWWLLPPAVACLLAASLWRETRRRTSA